MGHGIVVAGPGRLQPKSRTTRMWQPPVHLQDQPKSKVSREEWERGKAKAERRAEWLAEQRRTEQENKRAERNRASKPVLDELETAPDSDEAKARQAAARDIAEGSMKDADEPPLSPASSKVLKKFYSTRKAARREEE